MALPEVGVVATLLAQPQIHIAIVICNVPIVVVVVVVVVTTAGRIVAIASQWVVSTTWRGWRPSTAGSKCHF